MFISLLEKSQEGSVAEREDEHNIAESDWQSVLFSKPTTDMQTILTLLTPSIQDNQTPLINVTI